MGGFSTGIEALDTLLFGDRLYREDSAAGSAGISSGLHDGEVLLIRGEPGAGKTTLALQIVTNILRDVPEAAALFVTVEESEEAIKRKRQAYGFGGERLQYLDREQTSNLIQPGSLDRLPRVERWIAKGAGLLARSSAASHVNPTPLNSAAATVSTQMFEDAFTRFLEACQHSFKAQGGSPARTLLVIDSLNAFINLLVDLYPGTRPRILFNRFCARLRAGAGGVHPVIILTGEYHFHVPETDKELPESFFCDTEIVLRTEPVRSARQHSPVDRVTLGYDRTALAPRDARSLEARSFCRVLKSRRSRNQSRRCAYDIEPHKGVRFFETYPGDGTLLVFAENEKQREVWGAFQDRDIPDSYPALRYESFAMKGLQSVYDSTRRLHNVPLRTDMHLSTLDSYWVVGYRDYRFKKTINEALLRLIDKNVDPTTKRPKVERTTLGPPAATERARSDSERPAPGRAAQTEQERADQQRADRARVEYPRLVNDLLYYALLHSERTLCEGTLEHLTKRDSEEARRNAVAQRITKVSRLLTETRDQVSDRYAATAQYLFGVSCSELFEVATRNVELKDTFLRPLPRSKIVLYGQYNSNLLHSLRREDMHQIIKDEDHWLAVPYDANVGVFVVRKDLFEHALALLDPSSDVVEPAWREKCEATQAAFRAAFDRLKQGELAMLEELAQLVEGPRGAEFGLEPDELTAVAQATRDAIKECKAAADDVAQVLGSLHRDVLDPGKPTSRLTWDQVLCLSAAIEAPLGIEARTFDTLMAFFLEMIWNCGGSLSVDARYRVKDVAKQIVPLARALHYFRAIFELTPTPRTQTLDPLQQDGSASPYGRWLFSRFWYSTLVDALTAKHETGPDKDKHVWPSSGDDPRTALEIIRMPQGCTGPCGHHACWGEWNLALLSGSENVALACDLVSNLMGALKIRERGLRGAALPTVREFYKAYADERCIPIDLRVDIVPPQMTFEQLRGSYLEARPSDSAGAAAIFRQSIFDYRHCAAEIHAQLLATKDSANSGQTPAEKALLIVKRIQSLHDEYLFIGDSFTYDTVLAGRERALRRTRDSWRAVETTNGGASHVAELRPVGQSGTE